MKRNHAKALAKSRVKWDRDPQQQTLGDTRTKRLRTRSAQEAKAILEGLNDDDPGANGYLSTEY